MAVLYPPYLEGTIPAQIGDTLRIPYQLNRAQGPADLKEATIHARIKTVSTNRAVFDTELTTSFVNSTTDIYYAEFVIPQALDIGQYYKIQLAFSAKDNPAAYYSTVGVFKYTTQPQVEILNFDGIQTNGGAFSHTGKYKTQDPNEKVKEYKFDIWKENNLFYSTGWQIHNVKNDISSMESQDEMAFTKFENNKRYFIQYTVKTINGLECSSPKYSFYYCHLNESSMQPYPFNIEANMDREEGCINLHLSVTSPIVAISGKFQIVRKEIGEIDWSQIGPVLIDANVNTNEYLNIFSDYSVEQGKIYQYGIFQQNDQVSSVVGYILNTNEVKVDFEDIFLFDGERQLKVKYDPKVSSLKTTVLESKLDTIGGQYPKFFRNGRVGYKELPLSGLISYSMDDNESFILGVLDKTTRQNTPSRENCEFGPAEEMRRERDFKLKVLDWLNNGQPKLLRTGPEGNYIVRLMNISLSPNDTLGRRLHTFSATAYEMADYTFDNLRHYGLMSKGYEKTEKLHFCTQKIEANKTISIPPSVYGRILNVGEGSKFKLTFQDYSSTEIYIGASNTYNIYIDSSNPLIECTAINIEAEGYLEYGFLKASTYPIYGQNGKPIISFKKVLNIQQITDGLSTPLTNLLYCRIYQKNIIPKSQLEPGASYFSTALYSDESGYYKYDVVSDSLIQIDNTESLFCVCFDNDQSYYESNVYTYEQNEQVEILGRMEYNAQDLKDVTIVSAGPGIVIEYYQYQDKIEQEENVL